MFSFCTIGPWKCLCLAFFLAHILWNKTRIVLVYLSPPPIYVYGVCVCIRTCTWVHVETRNWHLESSSMAHSLSRKLLHLNPKLADKASLASKLAPGFLSTLVVLQCVCSLAHLAYTCILGIQAPVLTPVASVQAFYCWPISSTRLLFLQREQLLPHLSPYFLVPVTLVLN